jgi:hypothetical protein
LSSIHTTSELKVAGHQLHGTLFSDVLVKIARLQNGAQAFVGTNARHAQHYSMSAVRWRTRGASAMKFTSMFWPQPFGHCIILSSDCRQSKACCVHVCVQVCLNGASVTPLPCLPLAVSHSLRLPVSCPRARAKWGCAAAQATELPPQPDGA